MAATAEGSPGICDACGKKYAWLPQLAGKTVRCKCGGGSVHFGGQGGGAAPSFAKPRAGGAKGGDSQKQAEIKKVVMTVVGLALFVGIIIGANFAYKSMTRETAKNLPGMDGAVERMTKDDGATEIREWLAANPQRGIVAYAWTRNRLEGKVNDWYENGAKKVLAFGSFMTASLAIELPDDKKKRVFFFDYATHFREHDGNFAGLPQTDEGQKYIVLTFMSVPGK